MKSSVRALALVFALVLGCKSEVPCTAVCEADCEMIVVCADGNPPTGDAYDACVDACVGYLEEVGVESEEECECDDAESCAAAPPGPFFVDYTC